MGNKTIVRKTGIVCAVFACLVGCAQVQKTDDKADYYWNEITSLEAIISENAGSARSWQAHYELAQLYTNHRNPWRDYDKALDNLQIYARHQPTSANDLEVQNWLSVLKELQHQSPKLALKDQKLQQLRSELHQSKQAVLALQQTAQGLENANTLLEMRNAELGSKINILKTLDQGVEEKRENYSDN